LTIRSLRPLLTWRVPLAFLLWSLALAGAGCSRTDEIGPSMTVLKIGYQKWGVLRLVKARHGLDDRLAGQGIHVEWLEFPSGPPLLEALNAGAIHFGHGGDSPPVFAQAANVPLVYVGASTSSPASSAIVVRGDSSIKDLAGLRGKRVALVKGSSAHTLLLRALPSAGLTLNDVDPVYLAPADARAALEAGAVDAWSIWDPYLAAAEQEAGVRVLRDGKGIVPGREFYLASAELVSRRRDLVAVVLQELAAIKAWAEPRQREVSELFSAEIGMSADILERAERRRHRYGFETSAEVIIAEQQRLADEFFDLGLLPRRVMVRDVVDLVNVERP
jgi:sulfonate transport system substrate-binding protein